MVENLEAFIQPFFASYLIPIAVFTGFLLSSAWLTFFLLEDREKPEPKRVILKAFFVGMLSALSAIGLEKIFISIAPTIGLQSHSLGVIFGNSLIEEFSKFAVVFVFISVSKYFDEPVDRMIYMIVAGLGFATTENFFFLSNAASSAELIGLTVLRFAGATLMHALTSGMLGYYWARSMIFLGLIAATIVHTVFNLLVLSFGPEFYPTTFLIAVSFVLFYEFDRIKAYYYERKKHRGGGYPPRGE